MSLPKSTVSAIKRKYEERDNHTNLARGGYRHSKLNPTNKRKLLDLFEADCSMTMKRAKTILQNRHQLDLSKSTISRVLSTEDFTLKTTKKVPKARNDQKAIDARYELEICVLFTHFSFRYATWWDKLKVSHSKIFFLDETGFSVSTRRTKGWARKGTPASSVCPVIRSKNISALAVISIMGSFFYEIKDSAYNTTDFCAFLLRLFDKFDQKGISNAVIIMDNVPFHKSDAVKSLFETKGHTIQYLPPYSPFLNPIENVFSVWKSYVRNPPIRRVDELHDRIKAAAENITSEKIENCYLHTKDYLDLSRKRMEILN